MTTLENTSTLSEFQTAALQCAFMDLVNSYNAHTSQDFDHHDWNAHRDSISEMLEVFPFLNQDGYIIEEDEIEDKE